MAVNLKQFVQGLVESGLMTTNEIRAFRESLPPEKRVASVETLARELVKQGKLTSYQSTRIADGRPKGMILGKNVILEKIGEGGMGEVFRAEHRVMKRPVVVKVLPESAMDSEYSLRRFQREVESAAQLTHRNIVTAYDADEQDGVHFLVMEYVNGDDLGMIVTRDGPLPPHKAIDCILQAARGLEYAHAQGMVHRDIKPDNLLLDSDGVVKILDMGLARFALAEGAKDDGLTRDNQIIGTVDYMSPEQADDSAHVDQRSDIYALGCTLFRLLTGMPPYQGSSIVKKLMSHRTDPIPSLRSNRDDVSEELDNIFKRMVAKDPRERYQSMTEVIRDLESFVHDTGFEVGDPSKQPGAHLGSTSKTTVLDKGEIGGRIAATLDLQKSDLTVDTRLDQETQTGLVSPMAGGGRAKKVTDKAVGIDLGTTFSAVAYLDDTGRPQTLMNAEGDNTTPSVLLFEGDEIIVGKEAVKAMATDMDMIAECAKRDLGLRSFTKKFEEKEYPPEVLEAWILNKLRQDAQQQIGDFQKVVITVPAYFDETRRKATQDAGYIAGFEVMDIINEPTAAAIAYGYQQGFLTPDGNGPKQKILVYDLGGGTFDVTIMETDGREFVALATDGDVRLGGRDFDDRLVTYVAEQFIQQHGIDPREDSNSLGRLWRTCEDAKRTLAARQKTSINCDYQGHASLVEVTREQFEDMTNDLLGRTEFTIRQTLNAAGLTWADIDRVLLVGGSTRMPSVGAMLKRTSGKEPDRSVSPDEAVAHGAALHAALLLERRVGKAPRFTVTNVNSHNLAVVGTNKETKRRQNSVIVPRNTPLPVTAEQVFYTHKDGQQSVFVQIVEGESEVPEECSQVGQCAVRDLPKDLPARTPIRVHFHYKENGRLTVRVKVHGTDKFIRQEISRENSLSKEQLDEWRKHVSGLESTLKSDSPSSSDISPTQQPASREDSSDELKLAEDSSDELKLRDDG